MIYSKEETGNFSAQSFAHLVVDEKDNILTITLNRPEKKNALNPVMINEIAYSLSYAHFNNDIWLVKIQSSGSVFCAGADLKSFSAAEEEPTVSTIPKPKSEVLIGELFTQLHKPCIARVHAAVYAGGFLIICGCTQVVASEDATFCLPEVKRGLWPMQVMQSLLGIIPPRKALDLCMRGNTLSCREALDLGIVTTMAPAGRLDETVEALVQEIKANSPSAIRFGLKAYDELRSISEQDKHKYLKKMLYEVLKTKDAGEGIAAFKEKRKPKWTGN